jgi:predicted O-methyltransferase YrrM
MKTKQDYDVAFAEECKQFYPAIDAFELVCGHGINPIRLRDAARVLACPVKANPPNWQHGRVLYSVARSLLECDPSPGLFLDIGTAKGFSAVVMGWAIEDMRQEHEVHSVDILDPNDLVPRNSVVEVDGNLMSVYDFVAPFIASVPTTFYGGGSERLLSRLLNSGSRIRLAFVDGKHNEAAVTAEIAAIARLQQLGDVIVFDDVQISGVDFAVRRIMGYHVQRLRANDRRQYAIATKL